MFAIPVRAVFTVVPGWQDVRESWEASSGRQLREEHPPSYNLLATLTLYQLTELIARNWKRPAGTSQPGMKLRQRGLRNLFKAGGRRKKEVNTFRRDMKQIRYQRNVIADSKNLVSPEDCQRLYILTTDWLEMLGVHAASEGGRRSG